MNSLTILAFVALLAVPAMAGDGLPVLHQNDVVLFQGDSITDGGRQRTGNDFNHTMGQGYAYIIAAQLGALYPERNLTFFNRGIDGSSVIDLAGRWQSDTLAIKPNLLSILIGVNDTLFRDANSESIEQFAQAYDQLLADTLAASPNIKIVLGQPFILPVANSHGWPNLSDQRIFDAKLVEIQKHQAIVTRLAQKYHLPQVLYQKAFDEACRKAPADHWCWDGVHPTYAGHGLMAQEWLRTVQAFWPLK